jgi:hypothetical protein
MRRMPYVWSSERRLGDPADGEHAASTCELACEGQTCLDLPARRRPIRRGAARMRWHDVPEEDSVVETELVENAVDDRRGGLAGRPSRQLPFGRERDARDARPAVSGGLADQQERRVRAGVEVTVETQREPLVLVLVERVADTRAGEPLYQRSQCTTSSRSRRRCVKRLVARLAFGSGLGLPTVTPATTWTSSGMPSRSLNACLSGTVTP